MKRVFSVLIGLLAFSALARGAHYEIPLSELQGVYSTGDIPLRSGRQIIGLPAAFTHIDQITLDVTGDVTPALWRPRSGSADVTLADSTCEEYYPALDFHLAATNESGFKEAALGAHLVVAENGPFHLQQPMRDEGAIPGSPYLIPFAVLLHDQFFAMRLYVMYDYPGDLTEVEQAIPGLATITDARLIIEGTLVPEPTSALLILPASLILTRRIRRPCVE